MGNCAGTLNCTAGAGTQVLSTDVAGTGIIVSFLFSAFITLAAVTYGYLSDSLPNTHAHELDNSIITAFRHRHDQLLDFEIVKCCKSWTGRILGCLRFKSKERPTSPPANALVTKQDRQEALTRFILSLSDQQLVTGLGILVAAVSNQCTLSGAEFDIALSLAWFSATVHLVALDVLQSYFRANPVLRNWRVLGMVAILCLLVYCLFTTMFRDRTESWIPVACLIQGRNIYHSLDPWKIATIVGPWGLTLFILVWNYIAKIRNTFWDTRSQLSTCSTIEQYTLFAIVKLFRRDIDATLDEWKPLFNEIKTESLSREKQAFLESVNHQSSYLQRWTSSMKFYESSHLARAPAHAFMVANGLGSFMLFYIAYDVWRQGSHMGFGQIIPILLLLLPLFSAGEVYYGSRSHTSRSVLPIRDPPRNRPESIPSPTAGPDISNSQPGNMDEYSWQYDAHVSKIRELLYQETKHIQIMERQSGCARNKGKRIMQEKTSLYERFLSLTSAERSLRPLIKPSLVYFAIEAMFFFTLGAILNLPAETLVDMSFVIAAAFLLIIHVLWKVVLWVAKMRRWGGLSGDLSTSNTDRLLNELRVLGSEDSAQRV